MLDQKITDITRVTKDQIAALARLRLFTVRDLLYHFPVRYEEPGMSGSVSTLVHGDKVTLYGRLIKVEAKKLWKSKRAAAEGTFEDSTGRVRVLWFNQPYMAKMAPINQPIALKGVVAGKDRPYITNPEVEPLSGSAIPEGMFATQDTDNTPGGLFPVYPETKGITSRWFYHTIKKIFDDEMVLALPDPIPEKIRTLLHLPDVYTSLLHIHLPQTKKSTDAARKRFAFEEIFVIQTGKQLERLENARERAFEVTTDRTRLAQFVRSLPFPLTNAQERAVTDITADFEKPHPMARLLEGDVGSGKTAVAAATAYAVVTSRPKGRTSGTLQVAYMAPTEILATQHFYSFIEYFKEIPINIALITGSGCYKYPSKIHRGKPTPISRTQLLKWVKNGEIAMVVGTHALIQKKVAFKHLAYAIVDEQHRFGTKQRKALAQKGDATPHFLSMTATPIPRTLALTLYGDLDLSVLDELPKNRAGVITKIITKEKRAEAYTAIRALLKEGRQAYVICPRIDEPDPEKEMALRAKSVTEEAARLKREVFQEYTIGILHGKMSSNEKDAVMKQFSEGSIDVLVATSVVEVGVNVPNATSIMIEGAERFGLAQLHQLRGRVLRSAHEALCFLLPESKSETSRERLKALEKTRSGFELAEYDLQLRGAGDLYGRVQWGVTDMGMEALRNPRLIEAARSAAQQVVMDDPTLLHKAALAARVAASAERLHQE
ncbi:MAG: ATP-dependent DNA helicase RecG [Candidatus Pacebacteria bacterium]|nr:ATP-dependent DNA helicase RecG [Candidatus Paceibacterota bacterium]